MEALDDPDKVVARLDQLGWSPERYKLLAYSHRHALLEYGSVFGALLLNLEDGHEVARYRNVRSGSEAFTIVADRDGEAATPERA